MTVTEVGPGRARLRVTLPGRLRSRQGRNLPGSDLGVPSLTDKDLQDLDWTARHADDIQFVGLSFVRGAEDVARLRRELAARNCPAKVVVKIEKPEAVRQLEGIVDVQEDGHDDPSRRLAGHEPPGDGARDQAEQHPQQNAHGRSPV
jgi:pyruvate kinase